MRRELRFWEAIALSIGIMAPGALAFVFASIGILFVSYAFIRLTGYFNHAGSVYALSGVTLGPRAGFFSGWALMGTYMSFTAASTAEVGLFGQAFLDGTGIWPNAEWLVISLVAAALIWFIAYGDVKVATRALLSMEGLTVALIVVVVVVIFARVFAGTAPSGQSFTLSPFTPPSGVGLGTVALAAVFGLLSFGGFERTASLGEETDNPRRDIPRAIATAVITMGIFYTIVMLAQTLGFGVDAQGSERFAGSSSPLGDLSRSYVGPIMADAINFGVMVSAFASALGTATAGSRMLFALCRDGFLSRRLGETSDRTGSPANALAVVMVIAIVAFVAQRIGGVSAVNAFFYPGTIGVLAMLVTYIVTNVGALRFLFLSRRVRAWEAIFPVVALAILVYVIYANVYPVQDFPFNLFPYVVAVWLVVGLAIVLLVPGLARRIGVGLAEREGLAVEEVGRPQR
ncbi:MAG: APC family permease [Actinobacteria bacterium]|nr:APC family permease [Actinomycetota bacterium]